MFKKYPQHLTISLPGGKFPKTDFRYGLWIVAVSIVLFFFFVDLTLVKIKNIFCTNII